MALQIGTVLQSRKGSYRIARRLGEGGMGSVYLAEDRAHPGRQWAIKELLDDSTAPAEDVEWAKQRFEAEIKLMRDEGLKHRRMPAYHDDFTLGEHRFLVMEYIPGMNLEERQTRQRGPLPERDVLRWMVDICEVLDYLHRQRPPIIVRDLKPANIMITPDDEARLIDFGIARRFKPGQRTNTENLGTMTYASPEHLGRTQTDERSDIYSLGATMYHLLTNHEPTPLETPYPGKLRQYQSALSEATEAAVIKAMQIDPSARFQSVSQMRDALIKCLQLLTKTLPPTTAARSATPVAPARSAATVITPAVKPSAPPAPSTHAARPVRTAPPPFAARAATVAPAPPSQVDTICPLCGFVNRQNARFCSQDGTPLKPGNIPVVRTAPTVAGRGTTTPYVPLNNSMPSAAFGGAAVTTAELSLQKANEAYLARQYQRVVHECEIALSQGRQTYEVYLLLGRALNEQGRTQEAAAAFAEAVRLRPTLEAVKLEGAAWQKSGQLVQAQIAFSRARQLDPQDAETSYHLGAVCYELGQFAQAEGEFETAVKLRPNYTEALLALARVLVIRKQWDEAITAYQKLITLDAANTVGYLELGNTQLALKRPSDAVHSFEQAAKQKPNSDEIQLALGIGWQAAGNRKKAKAALQRAIQLNPKNTEAEQLLKQL